MVDKAELRAELVRRRLLTPQDRLKNFLNFAGFAGILLLVTVTLIWSLVVPAPDRSYVRVAEGWIATVVTMGLFLVFTLLAVLRFQDWHYLRKTTGFSGEGRL